MLKYIVTATLVLTIQVQALVINSQTIKSPDGKKTVYFLNDISLGHMQTAENQFNALTKILTDNPDTYICVDGFIRFNNYNLFTMQINQKQNALSILLHGNWQSSFLQKITTNFQSNNFLEEDPRSLIFDKEFIKKTKLEEVYEKVGSMLKELKQNEALDIDLAHLLTIQDASQSTSGKLIDLFDCQVLNSIFNKEYDSIIVLSGMYHSFRLIPFLEGHGFTTVNKVGPQFSFSQLQEKDDALYTTITQASLKTMSKALHKDYERLSNLGLCSHNLINHWHTNGLKAMNEHLGEPLTPEQILSIVG